MISPEAFPFKSCDILLPKSGHEKWAAIACDQFTSEPEYWEEAEKIVGDEPSSLRLILPEIYLDRGDLSRRVADINLCMRQYLDGGVFKEYKDAMIYVERTLPGGAVRRGLVAAADLDAYDYRPEKKALIRATEGTVLERIPPRVRIRRDAPLELPHVMLLYDDPAETVLPSLADGGFERVYDFTLMLGGGHLKGYLLPKETQNKITDALAALTENQNDPILFAVGDGNHSLAAAKTCYENNGLPRARRTLAEAVNIHDPALVFEPIYRVLYGVKAEELFAELKKAFSCGGGGVPFEFISRDFNGAFYTEGFPVGALQAFLDRYVLTHCGVKIDYIHGEAVLRRLAFAEGCAGFIFDGMKKSELFDIVRRDGVLPRKSFSMGEAAGKRYYMEARRIR